MQNQPQRKIVKIIRLTVIAMLATSATLLMLMITHRQLRYDDINTIRQDGGVVHTRSELSDLLKRRLSTWYPEWFETPYAVWLPAGYGDDKLVLLKRFENLSTISLEGTSISNEGVRQLSQFEELRLLTLSDGISKDTERFMRDELPQLVTIR